MSYFKAKMHQIRFRLGLRPDPAVGASSAPPNPLAGFREPTSEERLEEERRKGRDGREGKGREGKGGRKEERREGNKGGGTLLISLRAGETYYKLMTFAALFSPSPRVFCPCNIQKRWTPIFRCTGHSETPVS